MKPSSSEAGSSEEGVVALYGRGSDGGGETGETEKQDKGSEKGRGSLDGTDDKVKCKRRRATKP